MTLEKPAPNELFHARYATVLEQFLDLYDDLVPVEALDINHDRPLDNHLQKHFIQLYTNKYYDRDLMQLTNAPHNKDIVKEIIREINKLTIRRLLDVNYTISDEIGMANNFALLADLYSKFGRCFFDINTLKLFINEQTPALYKEFVLEIYNAKNPYQTIKNLPKPNLTAESVAQALQLLDEALNSLFKASGYKFKDPVSWHKFKAIILLQGILGEQFNKSDLYNLIILPILNELPPIYTQYCQDIIKHIDYMYRFAYQHDPAEINVIDQFIKDKWQEAGLDINGIEICVTIQAKQEIGEIIKDIKSADAFSAKSYNLLAEAIAKSGRNIPKDIEKKIQTCQAFLNPKKLLHATLGGAEGLKVIKNYAIQINNYARSIIDANIIDIEPIDKALSIVAFSNDTTPQANQFYRIIIKKITEPLVVKVLENINELRLVVEEEKIPDEPRNSELPTKPMQVIYEVKNEVLQDAPLSMANLQNKNLKLVYFGQDELNYPNFSRANLVWTNFTNLRSINDGNFESANLCGANLRNVFWRDMNFRGADLRGANLSGAKFNNADFTGANLSGANLTRTIFYDSTLKNANLIGANLVGAEMYSADLAGTKLTAANLANTVLHFSNLEGAYLERAILTRGDLYFARLKKACCIGANFRDANLSFVELTGANLTRSSLQGAKLEGSDLENANLEYAILCGANLAGTELFNMYRNMRESMYENQKNFKKVKLKGAVCIGASVSSAVTINTITELSNILRTRKFNPNDPNIIPPELFDHYASAAFYLLPTVDEGEKIKLEYQIGKEQLFTFLLGLTPSKAERSEINPNSSVLIIEDKSEEKAPAPNNPAPTPSIKWQSSVARANQHPQMEPEVIKRILVPYIRGF